MQLTFSLAERPASLSVLSASERDWQIRVATSCLAILPLLIDTGPDGWYGRTCPASCQVTADGILESSSGGWGNSGMGSLTGFLTLNTSEWNHIPAPFPSGDGVCSLSDILETGAVPQRYYLSGRACRGILRRAAKRGKQLPPFLHAALEAVALGQIWSVTAD